MRLGGPICCIVSGKILGCKLRTNLRQVARRGSCWANCYIVLSDAEWEVYTTPPYRATAPLCFTTHRNGQRNGPTEAQWGPSAPPRRPEPRFIAQMALPKQEDTTTSWRRERGPSRRSTAHRLRPLINRQDRIESSTAPACSSADTISRSHTAPKIMRLRYERRAPCFVPYYTRRRPRRRESHRTQSLKTPSARSRTRP